MPRNILIAGIGYVGTALAERLVARGCIVWGLRRSAVALAGVRSIAADLTTGSGLDALPRAIDAVVYAVSPDGAHEAEYRASFVTGQANLARALGYAGARVERAVFVSSTAVYGERDGTWVDESTAPAPEDFRGSILLEAEAAARTLCAHTTAVRFAGIYGPGRHRMIDALRRGERYTERERRYTNRIHRDDCAALIDQLLQVPHPPEVVLGVDREPCEKRAVVQYIAGRLGCPELASTPEDGSLASAAARGKRCRSIVVDKLGYTFRYPTFREGYGALIDGLQLDGPSPNAQSVS